ncbi:MAG: type II toxin-antitoxin system RelE/ParE family toxin [Coprothermobacterota bacterium]|nr:type II toxin-antitoxin system RelE/ParE family toxin [Coprothermobacterota bacterium]
MYRLEVSPAADRDLGKLKGRMQKQDLERLREAVRGLAEEPRPHGVRRIKGTQRSYRIRVGDYRIVYEIYDVDALVVVLLVSRRTETTYR